MKGTGDRADDGFDRLLRNEVGHEAAAPVPCPQVELLAAWYDHSLPAGADSRFASAHDREEAASIEAHVAACERCRKLVASLAVSEPEVLYVHPQHQPASSSWTWHLRWLAPVSAAAVILLVAVVGAQLFRAPAFDSVASNRAVGEAVPAPGTEPARDVLPASPLESVAVAPAAPPPAAQERAVRVAPPLASKPVEEGTSAQGMTKSMGQETTAGNAPRRQLADAEFTERRAVAKEKKVGEPPSESQMMAKEGAMREEVAAAPADSATRRVVVPLPAPSAAPPKPEAGIAMRQTGLGGNASWALVPGAEVGWRVGGPGIVQRTDDGGRSWRAQTLPKTARLSMLSVVSPSICWGAGPGGVIARTVDGSRWQTVAPPVAAEFVSLSAASADRATVATGDGTAYDTSDGGRTWQRRQGP